MTMPKITIDMILSDPMLLVGTGLVLFSLLLFLVSLWKLIFYSRSAKKFVVPVEGTHDDVFASSEEPLQEEPSPEPVAPTPAPVELSVSEPAPQGSIHPFPEPEAASSVPNGNSDPDKTVVMQASETETQMQLDIIVSQLKNLNRKVSELEEKLEGVPDMTNSPQEVATLREPPINPEDYTKKLLKLAEHVIVLEKEVARLKAAPKPPIMPL